MTTQLQFLLIAVAGWMSRHQQAVIEYLQEENRILLEVPVCSFHSRPLGVFERPAAAHGFVELNDREPACGLDM